MIAVTIHSLSMAREFFASLSAFTQNARLTIMPEGMEVHAKCQVPSQMKLSYYTNAISSDRGVMVCFKEIQRFNLALKLIMEIRGETEVAKMSITDRGDFLVYDEKGLKFRISTVNEKSIDLNLSDFGVDDSKYDCEFTIRSAKLKLFFAQSSLVRSDAAKTYFTLNDNHTISLQLEDKKLSHAGMVAVPVTDIDAEKPTEKTYSGAFRPVGVAACLLRSMIRLPGDSITIRLTDFNTVIANASFNAGDFYIKSCLAIPEQKKE